MKKYLLILIFLTGGFLSAKAQENQAGDENKKVRDIEALYVAYVTKELDLTPDEAQKFWPVHKQFQNDIKAVNKDLPELQKQQAYLDVKKKYQDNFNKILGVNRCDKFFRIDGEFKRKLLDRIKQRNDQVRPNRPRLRRGQ